MRVALVGFCLLLSASAFGQLAIQGGTIHPVDGKVISNGTLLIEGKRIQYVGAFKKTPKGYKEIDARGKIVTPGLIDAANHLGLSEISLVRATVDGNEETEAVLPELRVLDALYLQSVAIVRARKQGITLAGVVPSGRNPFSGVGAVIRTYGLVTADAVIREEMGLHIRLGEPPKQLFDGKKAPSTRMGTVAMIRKAFAGALSHRAALKKPSREGPPPRRNLRQEALLKALDGKLKVWFHAHRASDIEAALRIAREFKLKPVIVRAAQSARMARLLNSAGVPVVIAPVMLTPFAMETQGATLATAGVLEKAGVRVAIGTLSTHDVRNLPFQVGFARAHGLSAQAALRAVTLTAAEILGVDKQLGSLSVGKDADIVVWNGDPFLVMSKPDKVIILGQVVEDKPEQP